MFQFFLNEFGVSFQFRSCQKVIKKHPFSCFGLYFLRLSFWSPTILYLHVLAMFIACVIILFRLALEKDPGYVRGLVLMGQALLQKTKLAEATEYLELAISKVRIFGPLLFFLPISPFCSLEVTWIMWFNIYHSLFCTFSLTNLFIYLCSGPLATYLVGSFYLLTV